MKVKYDLARLTFPILAEQSFFVLMGIVNTIMAGRIGKEAVAAVGMVDSLNFIFIAFFGAVAVGATVVVAQYVGRKNFALANESVKQALAFGMIVSVAIALLMWLFSNQILVFLYGAVEPQVMSDMKTYLHVTLLTYPCMTFTQIAWGSLRGTGDTKTPMKVNILMNVLNAAFGYLFIYGIHFSTPLGHFDFEGMGVLGAAIGITLAKGLGAVAAFVILHKGTHNIALTGIRSFRFKGDILGAVLGIGIPASIESLVFNCGKMITQVYITGMGTVAIASNYIAGSIVTFVNLPGIALGIAATTIVGQAIGRGEKAEAEKVLWHIIKVATISLTLFGILMYPLARPLVSLYTSNTEIVDLSVKVFHLTIFFMPTWALSFVLPAGLKGAGDARYTMSTTLIGMWIFRITLGYLLGVPLGLGVCGVWLGMFSDWIVRGILYLYRLKSGAWKHKQVIRADVKQPVLSE